MTISGTLTSIGPVTISYTTFQDGYIKYRIIKFLQVNSTGNIIVNGLGYSATTTNGNGPGGGFGSAGSSGAGGGSYGGLGGDGNTYSSGVTYANKSNVTLMGSAGGSSTAGTDGGPGGGIIIINASGANINLLGNITANSGVVGGSYPGGGSGGGIYLLANNITGTGALRVNGGSGTVQGGGGGGGRLYIEYCITNGTQVTTTATGGTGYNNGNGGTMFSVLDLNVCTNSTPTHTTPIINSSDIFNRTNATLTCLNQSTIDDDGDLVTNSYEWYKYGVIISGEITNTLDSSNFVKNDTILCEITPSDGFRNGTIKNSSVFVVANGAPTQNTPTLNSSDSLNRSNTTITCFNQSTSDIDGDIITNSYLWYRNGTLIIAQTTNVLSSGNFSVTDNVLCEVTPNDGTSNGERKNSTTITISNVIPSGTFITVTPSNNNDSEGNLTCYLNTTNDYESQPLFSLFKWYVNETLYDTYENFNDSTELQNLSFTTNDLTNYLSVPPTANVSYITINITGLLDFSNNYPTYASGTTAQESYYLGCNAGSLLQSNFLFLPNYNMTIDGIRISSSSIFENPCTMSDMHWSFSICQFNTSNLQNGSCTSPYTVLGNATGSSFGNGTTNYPSNTNPNYNITTGNHYSLRLFTNKTSVCSALDFCTPYIDVTNNNSLNVFSSNKTSGLTQKIANIELYSYPNNFYLSVGNQKVFNQSKINESLQTPTFASTINTYLSTCSTNKNFCDVPISYHSDSKGNITINDLLLSVNLLRGKEPTETIICEGTVYDGIDYGTPINSTTTTLTDNQPPSWSNNQINDTTIKYGDIITLSTTWYDNKLLSGWIFNSNITGTETNSTFNTTFSNNVSTHSSTIEVQNNAQFFYRFYTNDSSNNWNETTKFVVTMNNTAPRIVTITISNETFTIQKNETSSNNLTLSENETYNFSSTNVTDVDDDTINYNWFLDNIIQAITSIWSWIIGFTESTTTHNVTLLVNDSYGGEAQKYFNVTITNTNRPPTQSNPLITSTDSFNRTNSTLNCFNQSTDDADNNTVTNSYAWYRNGTILSGETTNELSSNQLNKSDSIICQITPNDGIINGDKKNSTSFLVLNTAPIVTLNKPINSEHSNKNGTLSYQDFNITFTDVDNDAGNCTLYINRTGGITPDISIGQAMEKISGNSNIIFSNSTLSDNTYVWLTSCSDGTTITNSTTRTLIIDTLFPDIDWIKPSQENNTYTNNVVYTLNVSCSDENLYRNNITLYNSSGDILSFNFTDNISSTSFNAVDQINFSGKNDQTFIIEESCSDDATFGKDPNLEGEKGKDEKDELLFKDKGTNKGIVLSSQFLNDKDMIITKPLDFTYGVEKVGVEYKFWYNLTIKTNYSVLMLDIVSDEPLNYRSPYSGKRAHFTFGNNYYIHFDDLPKTVDVEVIKVSEKEYTVILKQPSTVKAKDAWTTGKTIFLDPVVGGLNTQTEHVTLIKDTTPPSWSNNQTNDSDIRYGDIVVFNVTWNDDRLNGWVFETNDTGAITNTSLNTTFDSFNRSIIYYAITGTRGTNIFWRVYANDTVENWNVTDKFVFSINNWPPNKPTIITPVNVTYYNSIPVNITSTTTDNNPEDTSFIWYVYINDIFNRTTNTTSYSFNASDGNYTVTVMASDGIDNSSNATSKDFVIDTINPSISFYNKTADNGTLAGRDWVYVNVTVIDVNMDNLSIKLFNSTEVVSSQTIYGNNTSHNFTSLNAQEKVYYYNVTAFDKATNQNSTGTRNITLDTLPPRYNITVTPQTAIIGTNNVTITWNFTDLSLQSYFINVSYPNGTIFITQNTTWPTINLTTEQLTIVGYYPISIWANDTVGNINKTTITGSNTLLVTQTTGPNITLQAPTNGSTTTNGDLLFVYYVSSSIAVSNCTVFHNRDRPLSGITIDSTITTNSNQSFHETGFKSGHYHWLINCQDILGNTINSSQTWNLTVSIPGPTAKGGGVAQGTLYRATELTKQSQEKKQLLSTSFAESIKNSLKQLTILEKIFPEYKKNVLGDGICQPGEDPVFINSNDCTFDNKKFVSEKIYLLAWFTRYLFLIIITGLLYLRMNHDK